MLAHGPSFQDRSVLFKVHKPGSAIFARESRNNLRSMLPGAPRQIVCHTDVKHSFGPVGQDIDEETLVHGPPVRFPGAVQRVAKRSGALQTRDRRQLRASNAGACEDPGSAAHCLRVAPRPGNASGYGIGTSPTSFGTL